MFDLILSQGRVGDRAPRLIDGAVKTAAAIGARYGVAARSVGAPAAPVVDDWSESLPAARSTLTEVARAVDEAISAALPPVVVASTCSSGLATMPVVARRHPEVCVLYIDGHGDFNTPSTTDTGYLGGMVLSGVCGLWETGHGAGVDSRRAVLVGARDIEAKERALLQGAGVRVLGPVDATPAAVLDAAGAAPLWIHIDWDVLEPGHVPADYTVPAGLLPGKLRSVLAALPCEQVVGIEIAEFQAAQDDTIDRRATETILQIVGPVLDCLAGPDATRC